MSAETVKIVPDVLRAQVEEGWKLKPLAEHYGLPVAQMKKALQALGLTIRKFHAPKFEFVTDTVEEVAPSAQVEELTVVQQEEEVEVVAQEEATEQAGW